MTRTLPENLTYKSVFTTALEFKAAAQGEDPAIIGHFAGYGATFGKDIMGDRIEPGAFAQSIADKKGAVPILLTHMDDEWAGVSTKLYEDHKGLWVDASLFDTSAGRNAAAVLKGAKATGFPLAMSIGFITNEAEWDDSAQVRVLKSIDLWETSIVPFPANPRARVDLDTVKGLSPAELVLCRELKCSPADARRLVGLLPLKSSADADDPINHITAGLGMVQQLLGGS